MGVYNPLAEMPKNCAVCHEECKYRNITAHKRHKRCPLVEVKTPHGRLVDIKDINELMNRYKYDDFDHIDYHTPTVIKAEESK